MNAEYIAIGSWVIGVLIGIIIGYGIGYDRCKRINKKVKQCGRMKQMKLRGIKYG